MKKFVLSAAFAFASLMVAAQPAGGFGGFQMPEVHLETSQQWKDVNYAGDDKVFHTCDIYLPKEKKASYPVVVHIYGSAWFNNNGKGMADLGTIVKSLLDAGYAVVCPNHRSSMDAKWPAQIHDIKAVIRFVRGEAKKYHFDPSFIATSGFSSGGHLSSMAATTSHLKTTKVGAIDIDLEGKVGNYLHESSAVDAACDWSGPVDLTAMDCGQHMTMGDNSPEDVLLDSKIDKEPDKYVSLSATNYIDKNDPPVIIFHGEKDNVVPCCQGKKFFELLKAAGVSTEATFVPEGGHGMGMYAKENLDKMVDFLNAAKGKSTHFPTFARRERIVDNGGEGNYKAIMVQVEGFNDHTVFFPQDLSKFNAKNPLPVLVWGNGACSNSPWEHYRFLNEIASHGYLVVATGYFPKNDLPFEGAMSTPEQQVQSIDWAIAQNADKNSPLYSKVNVKAICAAGMSCGGLQTLFNCGDKRLTAYMICNSGLFIDPSIAMPNMPMQGKSQLEKIHAPIMYLLGGETDIAYKNGMDDFHRINNVPSLVVNFPVGHGGTYREEFGGEFRFPAVAWLDWQLKKDKNASKMFLGKKCGLLQRKSWTIERNAKMEKMK